MSAEALSCDHCRGALVPDRALPWCGHVVCGACYDAALRAIRVAEAFAQAEESAKKSRAA